jgi:acyl-CoA synthetase (AMP-forming)/AMP-acid ligase II
MSLIEAFCSLPPDQSILKGGIDARTVGDLLRMAEATGGRLSGRRVAIRLTDPVKAIEAMIAADGQAQAILLIPSRIPHEHLLLLLERAGCDLLISSEPCGAVLPPEIEVAYGLGSLEGSASPGGGDARESSWYLSTSGTTGVPKLVQHTLATLTRTSRRGMDSSGASNWGLLYEHCRFAGIQVILQALLSGSNLIAPAPEISMAEKLAMLISGGCTHLSATPTMWRKILMMPQAKGLPLRQITLGGEIADERVLATLGATYPGARVTHVYASTEAGVCFSVKDRKPGFPASYLDVPPTGIAVRIVDGMLQIRNTGVGSAYVGTRNRFEDDDGWIDTGDSVELSGDRVYFKGRACGVINVGGSKVYPEEIERLLLSHPEVLSARVYGKSSGFVGTLVAAEVVPVTLPENVASFLGHLKAFMKQRAPSYKVPAIIDIVESIETSPTGKVARRPTSE